MPRLDADTIAEVAGIGAELAVAPQVREVTFRDDTGAWNTDPDYPDGVYLGVKSRPFPDQDWNCDLWFVDAPDRQPDLADLSSLAPRLTRETRAAIVGIKQEWAHRPEYGHQVRSVDIYRAVLDDGVRDPTQFTRWRARR